MLERKICGTIIKAMRDMPEFGSCAVEVKVAKGRTLPCSALKPHQRRALLLATKSEGIYHKIADSVVYGQLPFDGVILKNAGAWLAIYFEGVKPAEVWAIDITKTPQGSVGLEFARKNGINIRCP